MSAVSGGLNIPTLLLVVLFVMAAAAYVFRAWSQWTALVAAVLTGGMAFLLWRVDLSAPIATLGQFSVDLTIPIQRFGFTLQLNTRALLPIQIAFAMTAVAMLLTAAIPQGDAFVSLALSLLAGYSALLMLTGAPLRPVLVIPLALIILTAVGAIALQAGRPARTGGALRWLVPPVLAFPLFMIANWYAEQIPLNPQDMHPVQMVGALLSLGLLLLMAPVPLHSGQPNAAQIAPPMSTALILSLHQLVLIYLVAETIHTFPMVRDASPFALWFSWAGLVTAIWAGLAAIGANHPGRLWSYTGLYDWGLILLLLTMSGAQGLSLALLLFALRIVNMFTAALGLMTIERHAGGLTPPHLSGLASRMPWTTALFFFGGLGLAGFPLTAGFAGHWAALQAVAQSDWRPAAIVMLASVGIAVGYIRLARLLFEPLTNLQLRRERPLGVITAMAVLLLSVWLALAPQTLSSLVGRAVLTLAR